MQAIIHAQRATKWIFFICGLGISSWAPMVPFAKERLRLNDASLGWLLLLIGAGAIIMMPITGILVHRYGSRIVVLGAALLMSILLPLLIIMHSLIGLAIVLFLFGVAVGTIDVAMNTQAVQVQNLKGVAIMSSFHGLYSVGGLAGSIGLGLLIKAGLSPEAAAVAIAIGILIITVTKYKYLLTPELEKKALQKFSTEPKATANRFSWLKRSVIFLGSMCFITFLAEGALLDWSAVFLRENRNVDEALTGMGYAAFSIAMAVMRLLGDKIVSKFSENVVVFWGSIIAASGMAIAIIMPWLTTTLLGFMLVGVGAANIVPVFFSEAGRIKNLSASIAIPVVTTIGYAGQLAGPALLGFIAFKFSLAAALGFNAFLLSLVAVAYYFKK